MTFVILACVLMLSMGVLVRPALAQGSGLTLTGFNGLGVLVGFTGFVTVAILLGPVFSFALILAFLLHEFGHVVAYRLAGHTDARFRLIPFLGETQVSDQPPSSDLDAFFISLMGPGVSLAPMVLSFALAHVLAPDAPVVADLFWQFGMAVGVLNFVQLLPLWPFDGGRCVRFMIQSVFPSVGPLAAAATSAALAGMALTLHSLLLFLLAMVGAIALILKREEPGQRPALTREQLRLALTAYFATLGCFFLAGWEVFRVILTLG